MPTAIARTFFGMSKDRLMELNIEDLAFSEEQAGGLLSLVREKGRVLPGHG